MAFSLDLLIKIESVGCLLKGEPTQLVSSVFFVFFLFFLLNSTNSAVGHIKIKEHRTQINMPTGAFSDIFGTFLFICAQ